MPLLEEDVVDMTTFGGLILLSLENMMAPFLRMTMAIVRPI